MCMCFKLDQLPCVCDFSKVCVCDSYQAVSTSACLPLAPTFSYKGELWKQNPAKFKSQGCMSLTPKLLRMDCEELR